MRRRGFTLAEVVLAIGILAVAGLAVVAVFSKLVGAQSKSGYQVVARLLAEQVLEEACLGGPAAWPELALPQVREFQLQGAPAPVPFNYQLRSAILRDPPATNPMGTLYQLEVEVWWWSETAGKSFRDTGRTSLTSRRVVYIEQ